METAIEFGELVGAQVRALIEAELEGAEETWRFVEQVGFKRNEDGQLEMQFLTFDMMRLDVDGKLRKHTVKIPILTLLPLPMLTIKEANINFDLTVERVLPTKQSPQPDRPNRPSDLTLIPRKTRAKLVTRVARTKKGPAETRTDMTVSVRMGQSDLTLGIERLLNTADLGVQDETNEQ